MEHVLPDYSTTSGVSSSKGIRFLDDEYPTLSSGVSSHVKNGACKNLLQSNIANKDKISDQKLHCDSVSYDSEGRTVSEIESASEWETDDEDNSYRQCIPDIKLEKQVLDATSENKSNETRKIEFISRNYSQPKSILRTSQNDLEDVKDTGKINNFSLPGRLWRTFWIINLLPIYGKFRNFF